MALGSAERNAYSARYMRPGRAAQRSAGAGYTTKVTVPGSQALSAAAPRRARPAPPRPVTRHACACATTGTPPQERAGSGVGAPRPLAARGGLAGRGGAPESLVPSGLRLQSADLGS